MPDSEQPADLSGDQSTRPSFSRRHSSKTSEVSQSLSEGSSSHKAGAYKPQRHVVGGTHGRLGARNTSIGKNLNKLPKVAAQDGQQTKPHTRSRSGDSSLPSSPRMTHTVKRNSSAFVIPRTSSHTALKKNHSSGHLPRQGSSKNIMKAARSSNKRTNSGRSDQTQQNQSQPPSPDVPDIPQQPMVRFDLGDDEPQAPGEEEWTEDSASQSPHTSRSQSASHTRSNSVQVDGYVQFPFTPPLSTCTASKKVLKKTKSVSFGKVSIFLFQKCTPPKECKVMCQNPDKVSNIVTRSRIIFTNNGFRPADVLPTTSDNLIPTLLRQSPTPQTHDLPERARAAISQINGSSSYRTSLPSRPPDADAITSRILQTHNALPQVSNVTASVAPDHHPSSIPHSQSSTLADGTPGRDLVSRFINGASGSGSAGGTPNEDSFLSRRATDDKNDLETNKRNRSIPNMSKVENHRRSVSAQLAAATTSELPPSRTQQKLMLQRASSAIEPGKHIPAVLPSRPGAPQLLGGSMGLPFGESAAAVQIQGLFNQTTKEYNVVRRFRNPLAESVRRLGESSDIRQKHIQRPKSSKGLGGSGSSSGGSLSQTYRESAATSSSNPHRQNTNSSQRTASSSKTEEGETLHTHRGRVSFDLPRRPAPQDSDDEIKGAKAESFGSDNGRVRDSAYEICRRMWALDYSGGGVAEG